jgi:hypothetical protein
VGLAVLVNLPLIALFAEREGGIGALMRAALGGYSGWQAISDVNPATSNTRTDAVSLISRFVGSPLSPVEQGILSGCILLLAALVVWRLAKDQTEPARNLAVSLMCLATSLIGFHRGYDLVLLTAPFVMAMRPGSMPQVPSWLRAAIVLLFSVLALNWVATESVLARWQLSRPLWLGVTSLNGVCVLVLFVIYLILGTRVGLHPERRPASEHPAASWAGTRVGGLSCC